MSESSLKFTGERFTPECVREIWYEHWHRYVFARRFAVGKRVLDAACGEGYGSALLADVAADVTGIDIAPQAIAHACDRYADRKNLRFMVGDATQLDVAAKSFDLVVSFETLEHVEAQRELIAGFDRALADDGILIISSPDKKTYSDDRGFANEFHVRELYQNELLDLLGTHFPQVQLFGQKLLFQSAIWQLDGATGSVDTATTSSGTPETGLKYDPLYFIAICSRKPLSAALPGLALFGDREESVYNHYNGEVRRNMTAGLRIAELEREVAALRSAATEALPWWRRLFPARR